MSNPYPPPTLTILNSIETPNMEIGVVNFQLLVDSDFATAGNIFQYEVWVHDVSDPLVPLVGGNDNSRFIPIENGYGSQQTGIVNQPIFSVPVPINLNYDNTSVYIKARAYAASLTSSVILYTEWSNSLLFVPPPEQPTIENAWLVGSDPYYSNIDELYVQLENNITYNVNDLKWLVSFYYVDENSNPQWIVSDLVNGAVSGTKILLDPVKFPTDLDASYPSSDVSVSVNTVYPYEIESNDYSSSISQISTTVTAVPADYEAPSNLAYTYNVYDEEEPSQTISLTWEAPADADIPNYNVDYYNVYVRLNGPHSSYAFDGSSNTLAYTYTIIDGECGDNYSFYVTAVFTSSGNESDASNTISVNYFEYPSAPVNTTVVWCNAGASGRIDLLLTWQNPTTAGCCGQDGDRYFHIRVLNGSSMVYERNELYDENKTTYMLFLNEIESTNTGIVEINLVTYDTNSSNTINGPVVPVDYVVNELPYVHDVVFGTNTLTFKVLTSTALSYIGQFIFNNSSTLQTQQMYSVLNVVPNYTVTVDTDTYYGEFLYSFSFAGAFFTNNGGSVPSELIISVSNNYGVTGHPALTLGF